MPDGKGDQWGRPVGLQIVGRHRGDAALLPVAALFEGGRNGPGPTPTD